MTAALTGFTIANFPSDILYDAGVLFIGSAKFGATSGPPKLSQNTAFENLAFDGKHAPIKGIDRQLHGEPVISFTMLEIGAAATGNQLAKLEPGSTSTTVTTVTTVTPAKSGILVASGSYATDVRVIWERGAAGSGNYFAVHFATALFKKFEISGQSLKSGLIAVEIAGRLDLSTQAIDDPAYTFEYRTALP